MSAKKSTVGIAAKPATVKSSITPDSLHAWNKYLAILHAAQGLLILIMSVSRSFPVTVNFLGIDTLASQGKSQPVLAAGTHHIFDVNLTWLVAIFFFMSAFAHGLMATKLRGMYERDLQKGINKIRWIEYAFSASTMLVAIGLLSGVYDLSSLLMLFGLSAVMNLLGFVMEVHNQGSRRVQWLSYIVGCIAGIIPWVVLGIYLVSAQLYGSGVPGFVYGIYLSLFVLFDCFAANMFLQYRRQGKWADYLYGERVYMILSLVAKTALAWQVFAGSLRP